MTDILIDIGIKVSVSIVVFVGTLIFNAAKNSKNEDIRNIAEKTAAVVEQLYAGCSAADKKNAFIKLIKEQKANVKKAVEYLEKHIIPVSKTINVFSVTHTNKTDDEDDNSEGLA